MMTMTVITDDDNKRWGDFMTIYIHNWIGKIGSPAHIQEKGDLRILFKVKHIIFIINLLLLKQFPNQLNKQTNKNTQTKQTHNTH